MFGHQKHRFHCALVTALSGLAVTHSVIAQVQISGSATHYRSIDAHLNIGDERLDILGMGTDPDDGTTYFVCKTQTVDNCPSPDQLHIYAHNPITNQWEFEGSIDHSRSLDIGCVSVDGDTIAIGRTFVNFGEDGVDIYRRGVNGVWAQEASLLPADNFPGNRFGYSVSLDGDRLAVGASKDDPDDEIHAWEGKGSVYIYDRINGNWTLTEKVAASDGSQGDEFGSSVAIRATTGGWSLIVGAPDHGTDPGGINEAGAVYAFQHDGNQWNQTDMTVNTTDPLVSGRYGDSGLGFDGQIVAAIDARDLHVLELDALGQFVPIGIWSSTSFLKDPVVVNREVVIGDSDGAIAGAGGVANVRRLSVDLAQTVNSTVHAAPQMFGFGDQFGNGVAFNGGVFLAGVPSFDGSGSNSGAIWSDAMGGNAYPTGLILEGQADPFSEFGHSIAVGDEWAVIGSPNSQSDCVQNTTGSVKLMRLIDRDWVQVTTIDPPTPGISHSFGHAVAVSGSWVAVSMPDYHRSGTTDHFGGIVLYKFTGNTLTDTQFIEGPDTDQGFGDSIALAGAHLAIGSPDAPGGGKVSVYERDAVNWYGFAGELMSTQVTADARYGSVLSMHNEELLIGAPDHNGATGIVESWDFDQGQQAWVSGSAFTAPSLVQGSRFGRAIAQTDDAVIIGLPGNAVLGGQVGVYIRSPQGFAPPNMIQQPSGVTEHGFGASIAAESNRVLIGHDDPAATRVHFMASNGTGLQHIQTLSVPTGDSAAGFGTAIAIGAETLFIGSPRESFTFGQVSGMVHLYESEIRFTVPECDMAMESDRIQWIQDDIPNGSEWFAYSVEVDEGYAIAGAPYEKYSFVYDGTTINGDNAGKATIFERTGLRTWTPVATFRGGSFDDPIGVTHSDWLGWSVDIERSTAVAGGIQGRSESFPVASGSIRIYERGPGGWSETGEIFPPMLGVPGEPPIRGFGESVDLDSTANFLAVGAANSSIGVTGTGAGFVYERSGSEWIPSQILIPPTATFADHIGNSISVEEGWAAIGAEDDDSVASSSGAVHLFRRAGLGSWIFHSTILSPTTTASARFGSALEMSRSDLGLTLVVSSPYEALNANGVGAAFVFVLDETNLQWNLIQRMDPEIVTTSVAYGSDVSIDHNTIAIGAPYLHNLPSPPSQWSGGVELYNLDSTASGFVRRTTIRPEPGQWGTNNGWGRSVGLSGGTVFMGTEWADGEPFDPANINMNDGAMVAHDIVCVPECPADMNGDGVLDFFDVSSFLAAIGSLDPAADFNGDGTIDFFDVSAFLSAFSAGC